ncbi:MAG: hypothetical protein AB1730_20310 [Myxococcota bacterium]|jgi:hypothetical protein
MRLGLAVVSLVMMAACVGEIGEINEPPVDDAGIDDGGAGGGSMGGGGGAAGGW